MLFMDCPYYSFLYHISRFAFLLPIRWLLRYQICTDQFIKNVRCPVHIIGGAKDRLIPYSQSEMLKVLTPDKITLHPIVGAGHNDLPDYPAYHDLLYDILHETFEV